MNREKLNNALKPLILSASGWRKVFAADGDEESFTLKITYEDRLLTAAMARVFAALVKKNTTGVSDHRPLITLGIDSRPTGPAMAAAMVPVYLDEGLHVRYTGICSAPEIMAWTGSERDLDGFCYISASHNPPGHNGVKFGLGGGVIGGSTASDLIAEYRCLISDDEAMKELEDLLNKPFSPTAEEVFESLRVNKNASYRSYLAFTRKVASQSEDTQKQDDFYSLIKKKISLRPLGVVAELNGSARSLSPDREYLESLGVKVISLNDKPGEIVHPIVPEGPNLDLCRSELDKAHARDAAFLLGYVPDCDGDRGNLVYFNSKTERSEILEAQEVFALSVLSELTFLARSEADMSRTAVAVNGPTSMRIDRIAVALGSRVERAEVGEANVVNRAAELRKEGMTVRILGEGSNGGNITHPAQVRDPLNTLQALMNLLLITSTDDNMGLFELWCNKSGQSQAYKDDFTLADIIATLPAFTTTSAFSPEAKFKITCTSHGRLKARYEEIFPAQWDKKKKELKDRWKITGWEERNMEGTSERIGSGPEFRSGQEKGGFKILFTDARGEYTDYIWMRGSGTEPVFRVLADCQGADTEREAWFLNWHKEIITLADAKA